ncbi:MAG TPA: hypothetical protein VMS64_18700 [Candidatus Methylomirabilis sp.]|nr:hypothetical protein [Candidatus Methylomirabilis sp.]
MNVGDEFGLAGRIMLVVDTALADDAKEACGELAAALAERTGVPVTMAEVPIDHLDRLRPALTGSDDTRIRECTPPPREAQPATMSGAPFLWRDDGRPDWARMWTAFCDLALYGGPPHRGPETPIRAPKGDDEVESDVEMIAEMRRGIWETTGLYAEPSAPGWLAVTCESVKMAAWLCAAIILENVDARLEDDRLLVPAGPGYQLKDEVKSIITVVAKTHHYWQAHLTGGRSGAGEGE